MARQGSEPKRRTRTEGEVNALTEWQGYWPADGKPAFELDEDLVNIVDSYKLVHETWVYKEADRIMEEGFGMDATPFSEQDLHVVEFAFRVAVAKCEMVIAKREGLLKKRKEARERHGQHLLKLDELEEAESERDVDAAKPKDKRLTRRTRAGITTTEVGKVKDVPTEMVGQRFFECECEVLAKRIRKADRRLWKLSRIVGYIRHGLYIRNQYRTGIQISEWTESKLPEMKLLLDVEDCPCLDCERTQKHRAWKRKHDAEGNLKMPRGSTKRLNMEGRKIFTWKQQEAEMKAEEDERSGKGPGVKVNGQKVRVFGNLGFMFKMK